MNERHNDPRSLAMLVASMLIFGSIGVFRRQIPLSSAFLAFTRGILGGLVVWGFRLARGRERAAKLPGKRRFLLILSGAAIGVNWILLFEAFEHTTVAVATLCYYMQPTIVVLLSPLVFRERLTGKKAACAAAAIVGMALVSGVIGGGEARGGSARGILLGLGAAVFYSAVVMMNKKLGGIDARQKTIVQLLSAGIVLIPYLLLTGGFRDAAIQGTTLPLLLILGVVHTGIAYLLYFGSMDGLRVQSIALLSYIDPVSALFFSAVFLREPLTVPCIIGAVLIIGSAAVGEWQRKTT
jgi:RarD protein